MREMELLCPSPLGKFPVKLQFSILITLISSQRLRPDGKDPPMGEWERSNSPIAHEESKLFGSGPVTEVLVIMMVERSTTFQKSEEMEPSRLGLFPSFNVFSEDVVGGCRPWEITNQPCIGQIELLKVIMIHIRLGNGGIGWVVAGAEGRERRRKRGC